MAAMVEQKGGVAAAARLQPLALIDKCIGSRLWILTKVEIFHHHSHRLLHTNKVLLLVCSLSFRYL